jgi:hypothetical protein
MGTLPPMKPSYSVALVVGALTGLVLALSLTLYVGATGGVPAVNAVIDGSRVIPVFAPPASSLWIIVIATSAIGGFVQATATRSIARVIDPDAVTAPLWIIASLGIIIAPVVAMAIFPLGAVALGSLDGGVVTLSVVQIVALASTTGLVAGGAVVWLSYILTRHPESEGDASIHMDMADRSA